MMVRDVLALAAVVVSLSLPPSAQAAGADPHHEGYYYPPLTSQEQYQARAPILPDSDGLRRIGFVVGLAQQQLKRDYPPEVALFTKGDDHDKLIIMAQRQGAIASLYQARGFLARMTAIARGSEMFVANQVEDHYTFLDLLRLMGFKRVTISDGLTYAHQIEIADPRPTLAGQ